MRTIRVLFLDIDGVLNTGEYRREMGIAYFDRMIQDEKLCHLKRIVDETGAVIILSTSWRRYWNQDGSHTDPAGAYIQQVFDEAGLEIHGKTPDLEAATRNDEIRLWLKSRPFVRQYAIVDDHDHLWDSKLWRHFIQTHGDTEGLTQERTDAAISVLKGKLLPPQPLLQRLKRRLGK